MNLTYTCTLIHQDLQGTATLLDLAEPAADDHDTTA